jgi:hypothetical protein
MTEHLIRETYLSPRKNPGNLSSDGILELYHVGSYENLRGIGIPEVGVLCYLMMTNGSLS